MCRYKTQLINALSSTEADIIASVTSTKTASLLRYMLRQIGFNQDSPTPIYEKNYLTIDIVSSIIPTERTRHIDVWFFSIQVWKEAVDIIMHHTPGIINPVDHITKPLVGCVGCSYSGFPTLDSFERTQNYIPFVNSFPLFPPRVVPAPDGKIYLVDINGTR